MLRKKLHLFCISIFLIHFSAELLAQADGQVTPKLIPNSPEASSLGKFAEIPVSYYTGIPEINVPIYEVKSGNLQVNVGLSYHASGVKVDEIASWVGSGWALNAGGIITRSIRGRADDSDMFGGYLEFSKNKTFQSILNLPDDQRNTMYDGIAENCYDAEPDIYYLNVNGLTAKFGFKWNNEGLAIASDKKIKVNCIKQTVAGNAWPKIVGWDVNDEMGNVYKFRDMEYTFSAIPGGIACNAPESFASSWYLTEISDVNGERKIKFVYDSYSLDYGFKSSQTKKFSMNGSTSPCLPYAPATGIFEESVSRTQITGLIVKQIYTEDSSIVVNFIAGNDRTDNGNLTMPPGGTTQGFKFLDKIVIQNQQQAGEIQTYKLGYDYSVGRLTLKSLSTLNNNIAKSSPYQFSYNAGLPIPSSYNYSQDHWGFYNGESNNTLLPQQWISYPTGVVNSQGANRETNSVYVKSGVLSSIKYPTGGKTDFDFESNEYGFVQSQPLIYYNNTGSNFTYSVSVDGNSITVPTTRTTNFTILANPLNLTEPIPVQFFFAGYTEAVTLGQKPWVNVLNSSGVEIFFQRFNYDIGSPTPGYTEGYFAKLLPPGNYTLQAYTPVVPGNSATVTTDFKGYTSIPKYKKYCGGVRVKEIRQYASDSDPNYSTRRFKYNYELNDGKSSGVIYQEPLYLYDLTNYCYYAYGSGHAEHIGQYIVQVAQNKTVLGSTQGSHIGYRQVQVFYGKQNLLNGSKTINYISPVEAGDAIYFDLPFRPEASQSYKTGLSIDETDFRTNIVPSKKVKFSGNQYSYIEVSIPGLRIMKSLVGTNFPGLYSRHFLVGDYTNILGFSKVNTITEKMYDQTDELKSVTTITQNLFDTDLKKLVRQTVNTSDGKQAITQYFYPQDYLSPSAAIIKMKEFNMVGIPLEIVNKVVGATESVSTASYQKFDYSNNKLRLSNVSSLKTQQPIPSTSFSFSINNTNGTSDSRYQSQITYNDYDNKGNFLQYTPNFGVPKSYIWDYHKVYPIAEVTNAAQVEISHTSFEADGTGNWSGINTANIISDVNSITGKKHYNQTAFAISKGSLLSITNYTVSYWTKNSTAFTVAGTQAGWPKQGQIISINGQMWRNFEHRVSGVTTITVSGSGTIDELRLYPSIAQMTSYTYEPLIGIKSQCDANNRITYYEYDAKNQLVQIRDHNQNIIKKYCYSYSGQPIDCNPTNGPGVYTKIFHNAYPLNLQPYPSLTFGDVVVKFYSDAACSVPLSVSNLSLKYSSYSPCSETGGECNGCAITANGNTVTVATNQLLQYYDYEYYSNGQWITQDVECKVNYYIIKSDAYNIGR